MDTQLQVSDAFSPALFAAWADSRRGSKDLSRLINLAMRQWVSFAIKKIPKAQRPSIKARLESKATRATFDHGITRRTKTGREAKGVRYRMLRESLAAHIMWATNYTSRRGSVRKMSPDQFYAEVGRFIAARQFSAGYLKAGLYPALNKFKASRGEDTRSARYANLPGDALVAEPGNLFAYIADYAHGIMEVSPRAFLDSLPEIRLWIQRQIVQNHIERARERGLTVK